jgi:glucokinase
MIPTSSSSDPLADRQVLIDIDGVQAQFALGRPGLGLDVSSIKYYQTSGFPTATDCVQRFAQDAGIRLAGKKCAISVSGAVHGDSVRIARCPWIISVRGLGYLFQNDVHVLNDAAAKLWAATDCKSISHRSLGSYSLPDFTKAGQWLGIELEPGVGAALLVNQHNGARSHVATEAGHMAFAPVGDFEKELSAKLAVGNKPVSWEQALMAEIGDRARTEILGSFVGDLLLATGAWDGVLLFAKAATLLDNAANVLAYQKRVELRANHQLKLRAVPQWTVKLNNINLAGAARYLDSCEDG